MKRFQVAIVGGGPVGLALAVDLGQRRIRTVVFERNVHLHNIPKGQNLTQRTGEHFRAWNISEKVEAARKIPASVGIKGLTAYRTLLSNYHHDWLVRGDVSQYYSASNLRIPQYEFERVLRSRVADLPSVKVHYGRSVVGLEQNSDGNAVEIAGWDGTCETIAARLVIGCDGSRSVVRKSAGISQIVKPHGQHMILTLFHSEELHRLLERYPGRSYFKVLHPDQHGYWLFFGRVDNDGNWFFHCPVPDEANVESFDIAACLHAAVGSTFALDVEYIGFWNLRIAYAERYRKGDLFIAGDAAHSHPPYGAYGLNTGLEDARNLGWKISAMIKGWGGECLLDSYSAERQPVFASTAVDFIERMIQEDAQFLAEFDPDKDRETFEAEWKRRSSATQGDVLRYVPNYRGSPIVNGSLGHPSAVGSHSFEALPGHHLSPQKNVFDRLGQDFSLISVGNRPDAVGSFESAAARLSIPLTVIETEEDADTRKWCARSILVRPDHFVAYSGNAPAPDALEILAIATGRRPPST